MAEMVLNCPHCKAERVGFAFGGELADRSHWEGPKWNTLFVCHKCRVGVVVRLRGTRTGRKPSACQGDPRDEGFEVLTVHPKRPPRDIPRHLPEEIKRDYEEAVDCLLQRNVTAAGTMFRKVLERTTTALAAASGKQINLKRMKLEQRINELADHQLITPAMRDWAHQIRSDGNKAAHREVVETDATLMRHVTQLFLIYAFTLPEVVRQARGTGTDQDA